MHVRFMQLVDFWVGVPLCAALSIANSIILLFRSPAPIPPRKVLFIELSEMGSAILSYSALVKAQKLAGGEVSSFLIFRRNRESCEILNLIPEDRILVINDRSFPEFASSAFRTLLRLRAMAGMWRYISTASHRGIGRPRCAAGRNETRGCGLADRFTTNTTH